MCRDATIAVALSMVLPPSAIARQHLVERAEITARLQAAEAERATNKLKVERFVSTRIPAVAQGVGIQKLNAGLAAPSDEELRDLAGRAEALQSDPVAGGLTKTLVIVGVVVLVVRPARGRHREELQGAGRRVRELRLG